MQPARRPNPLEALFWDEGSAALGSWQVLPHGSAPTKPKVRQCFSVRTYGEQKAPDRPPCRCPKPWKTEKGQSFGPGLFLVPRGSVGGGVRKKRRTRPRTKRAEFCSETPMTPEQKPKASRDYRYRFNVDSATVLCTMAGAPNTREGVEVWVK